MINYLYNLTKKSLLLTFFVCSFTLVAQQEHIDLMNVFTIQNNSISDNEKYFYNGAIYLKDNSSVEGMISLNSRRNGEYNAILRTKDSCIYFSNDKIKYVVLHEKQNGTLQTTKFESLNENYHKLYRQIFYNDKKDIAVYDSSVKPFRNRLGYGVFVKENNIVTETYNFWTSGPKKDLINYINKRDNTKYRRRDFKSLQDLFEKL